jgi:hypothetical protein
MAALQRYVFRSDKPDSPSVELQELPEGRLRFSLDLHAPDFAEKTAGIAQPLRAACIQQARAAAGSRRQLVRVWPQITAACSTASSRW